MSPRWMRDDKYQVNSQLGATLLSNKGEWNNCFIKFSTFGFAKFYLSLRNDRKVSLC